MNTLLAATCLGAYRRGEDSIESRVGAMLEAGSMTAIIRFVRALSKG